MPQIPFAIGVAAGYDFNVVSRQPCRMERFLRHVRTDQRHPAKLHDTNSGGRPTMERLQKELETYAKHRQELVGKSEGKYVLIQGEEVAGIWDTYEDALKAGYGKFKLTPFLVKKIQGIESVQYFTRDLACQL